MEIFRIAILFVILLDVAIDTKSINWQGRISMNKIFAEIGDDKIRKMQDRPPFWERFLSSEVVLPDATSSQEPIVLAYHVRSCIDWFLCIN
jgi:hypothetical protein